MQERSELLILENDFTTEKTASTSYQGQKAPASKRKSSTQESSSKQKEDLKRQKEDLKSTFPDHELISDIGSDVNFKRKGLRRLLESVREGTIDQVVVAHRDCLARFAFDLIEFVYKQSGCQIVVHHSANKGESELDRVNELSEELLAITTHFTAQYYAWQRPNNHR